MKISQMLWPSNRFAQSICGIHINTVSSICISQSHSVLLISFSAPILCSLVKQSSIFISLFLWMASSTIRNTKGKMLYYYIVVQRNTHKIILQNTIQILSSKISNKLFNVPIKYGCFVLLRWHGK